MGENLFASYSSDKGLISRIYRGLKKLSPQRINTQMKKWAHKLKREFSKEEEQMVSKYMKKCSTSLAIKEMQIKTKLRFISPQLEWPESRVATTNAGEDLVKQEPLYTVGGDANYAIIQPL
jgi:hypothetical protein